MGYRADEEARLQRIETLEKELVTAQKEHAEATSAEQEQEAKREELAARIAELEAQLREAKHEPPRDATADQASSPAAPRTLRARIYEWATTAAGVAIAGAVLAGMFGPLICSVHECRPACTPVDHHVVLHWDSAVTVARGVNVPAGTPCTIDGTFFPDRDDELHLWEADVEVRCNGRLIFEHAGSASCAMEQLSQGRRWAYRMGNCPLSGETGDELPASVQWDATTLKVTGDGGGWSIEIGPLAPAESAESLYDPELVRSILPARLQFGAEVLVLSGSPPVSLGDACTILVDPRTATPEENCLVVVQCGQRVLRTTDAACALRDGELATVEAPGFSLDVERGVARVQEWEGPGLPYAASLRITGPLPP
jgi:hypothetical protein